MSSDDEWKPSVELCPLSRRRPPRQRRASTATKRDLQQVYEVDEEEDSDTSETFPLSKKSCPGLRFSEVSSFNALLRDAQAHRSDKGKLQKLQKESRQYAAANVAKDKELSAKDKELATKNKELAEKEKEIVTLKAAASAAAASAAAVASAAAASTVASGAMMPLESFYTKFTADATSGFRRVAAELKRSHEAEVQKINRENDKLMEAHTQKVEAIQRQNLLNYNKLAAEVKDSSISIPTVDIVEYQSDSKNDTWQSMDQSLYSVLLPLLNGSIPGPINYNYNSHKYEARVIIGSNGKSFVQKNISHSNATERPIRKNTVQAPASSLTPTSTPLPPAPNLALLPRDWRFELFTGKPCISLGPDQAANIRKAYFFQEDAKVIVGSKEIAELATEISSHVSKFKYSPVKSELWVNPGIARLWIDLAERRVYAGIRVVMHGSGNYDALREDPMGFDMAHSRNGLHDVGFYCASTDTVPESYREKGRSKYGKGTVMIGVLLESARARDGDVDKRDGCGSFTRYHLGRSATNWTSERDVKDCYAVYDQASFLPLGLAVT
jgi:hypothetical protein